MKTAILSPFSLLLAFCLMCSKCAAHPAQTRSVEDSSPVLDQDGRLNCKVTINETGIALKDLLHKLSDGHLTLASNPRCAEQKLQIRLVQRPLRDVMTSLASLLAGDWQPTAAKDGYIFKQSYSTLIRRQRWWSLFLGEREQGLAARRTAALQAMRSPLSPTTYHSSISDPEQAARETEAAKMRDQSTHDFFSGLPATLQEQLAQQMSEQPFYSQVRVDSGLSTEGVVALGILDLPQSARANVSRFIAGATTQNISGIAYSGIAYAALRFSGLGIRATFLDVSGKPIGNMLHDVHAPPLSAAIYLDHRSLPGQAKLLGRNTPSSWNVLIAYQTSRVWKNDPPAQQPSSDGPPPYRPAILAWLANKGNIEFVADYYSRPFRTWSEADQKQLFTRSIKAELDFRAAEQDMSWKQVGAIYLFRDNRWYRNDELEVPTSLLKRWTTELAEQDSIRPQKSGDSTLPAAFTKRVLNLRAEIATRLTPWQIINGLKYATLDINANGVPAFGIVPPTHLLQLPFGNAADLLIDNLQTLRFYQGLNEQQRESLLAGQLTFASLSDAERQQAVYVQGLLRIAMQKEQPVLLGLTPRLLEVHTYFDPVQGKYSWPNRTGIANIILDITSPRLFSDGH